MILYNCFFFICVQKTFLLCLLAFFFSDLLVSFFHSLVLQFEPDNPTAKEFYPVLVEKIKIGELACIKL